MTVQNGIREETQETVSALTHQLRNIFGFQSFRPYQEEIIQAILDGGDVFAVMPTGGGKSLCFQLPAHLMPGVCLVVSPLISLMKDQVDRANSTGLRAGFINSSQDARQRERVIHQVRKQPNMLLYVSPERLAMPDFKDMIMRVPVSFVAIDEAHCILEWGHDFRPDYLNVAQVVKWFPRAPVCAFTATATFDAQRAIITQLCLRQPHVVRASFNRPNLYYQVTPKTDPHRQILRFLRGRRGQSGIIYRTTRRSVELTADFLEEQGIKALPYHAGLEDEVRTANQEAFNRNEVDVMVATIAFGMGIDKPDIRFVIHADLPKNLEGYYQETGRAGRDGLPAHCLLLFGYSDIPKIEFFIDQIKHEELKKSALAALGEMIRYGSTFSCRRKQLLAYFGERYIPAPCGMCDSCARRGVGGILTRISG